MREFLGLSLILTLTLTLSLTQPTEIRMKSLIPSLSMFFMSLILLSASAVAAEFKVLVVMSYEENNPWVKEIREGIDGVLRPSSEVTYFHMNTKVNREGGPAKAEEAFALFKSMQPHGVITADDDAVTMFIQPYLKDKTPIPIMFNGVNPKFLCYPDPEARQGGSKLRGEGGFGLAAMILSTM